MAIFWLSHWNSSEKVFVPEHTLNNLKPYHLSIVRSLYRSFQKKCNGAILNYDEGINVPLGIQALLQALVNANKIKLPFLVIAADNNLLPWHYHLSQINEVLILTNKNCEKAFTKNDFSIILVKQSDVNLLQPYRENEFSFVIVENFDTMANKILFKRLSGEFNVALTKRNFMDDRDYKVLWHMLNWVNPGEFGKRHEFSKFDSEHLNNLRNPYDNVWFTFKYNVSACDLNNENEEYQKNLTNWAVEHKLPFSDPSNRRDPPKRKRKSTSPQKKNSKARKRSDKKAPEDEICNATYHEAETQLVSDAVNLDKIENVKKASPESKRLRDVSDLNCSILINDKIVGAKVKKYDKQPAFKPAFAQNKSVKRKSFEFPGDVSKANSSKDQYFPSLEDIFTLKHRDGAIPQRRKEFDHVKDPVNNEIIPKETSGSNLERGVASLEEVFKCKRVNSNVILQNQRHLEEFQSLDDNNINLQIALLDSIHLNEGNIQRICNKSKCKEVAIEKINYKDAPTRNIKYTAAKMVNKETQTVECQESSVTRQHASQADETTNVVRDSGNIEEARKNSDGSQKDADEDANVILSIVEGKFPTINTDLTEKLTTIDDIRADESINSTKPKEILLESLFGDESVNKPVESIFDDDILSNITQFDNVNAIRKQLRVKTIEQINCENSHRDSQDIYNSLKILFGNDADDDDKSQFGVNKHGKHNLISSLFG